MIKIFTVYRLVHLRLYYILHLGAKNSICIYQLNGQETIFNLHWSF